TIIFVTHDIYEAIKIADKIALMKQGRLVQYATPADLLYRPKDDFVAGFVGADRGIKGLQLIRTDEIMWISPPTAKPDEEAKAAQERMERKGIDWLPVIDDKGGFSGWVLASDLKEGQKVKEVMNISRITAFKSSVLSEALSIMLTSGRDVLAIINEHNRLEGVLTFQSIRETLMKAAQKEGINETSGNFR
ncbi:MAG: CBS domain-containing protein, partial [Bacteroidetes bacterium]|nr:CBS domain-containing protein [Bacteroidota bacterium]